MVKGVLGKCQGFFNAKDQGLWLGAYLFFLVFPIEYVDLVCFSFFELVTSCCSLMRGPTSLNDMSDLFSYILISRCETL